MRKLVLFLLLTSAIFARNVVSTTYEIQSAADNGCYSRTGDPSSVATITTSTIYDSTIVGTDCEVSASTYPFYDSEIDRVTAVTDCTVTQHVELNTTISDGVATISHINFTCATNCSTPVAPDGTTYQYTTASQSECNVNTLQSLLDQENPSSPYKVSDSQWVSCFDGSASSLNGCYVLLELKLSPDDNNTDSNSTSPDSNNSNNGNVNTSQIEQLLSEIHTDTSHIADDTYWLKNSFNEFIKEGNSSQLVDYYGQFSDQDINQSKKDFSDLLSSAGLDFNESNGSMFDTYKSAIDGFHSELYADLLDDNSSYSIKGLFASVLSEISTIGIDANPLVMFVEKGANITFPPIVLNYQNPTLSWLHFQITITSDDLFAGEMAPFWSMIRLFLIFFAVWYGFMILIRGL